MNIQFCGQDIKANPVIGVIGAFIIAIASSMFGFGGGPFMVPLMTVIMGLPIYVVVGSSLLAIFFNTLMASGKNVFFETIDYKLFVIMAVAAVDRRVPGTADREAHQPPLGQARGRCAAAGARDASARIVGVAESDTGTRRHGDTVTGKRSSSPCFFPSPVSAFLSVLLYDQVIGGSDDR